MDSKLENISQLFFHAAEMFPDKPAIINKNHSVTFGQLSVDVRHTAAYFTKKGIQKGDRVLVFVPMGIDLYRIVLALFYIGAVAVFLDEWVSKKRLELCCNLAQCKGFIGIPKARIFSFFSKELRKIPIKLGLRKMIARDIKMKTVDPDDSALITFTTGSTGIPKAADRTHGFLKEQFDVLIDEIDPKPSDVDMPVLPIVLFVNLGVGCTSVVANFKMTKPASLKEDLIVSQLRTNNVSRITSSPFFIKQLAKYMLAHDISLPKIEKIFTGGAPVFPDEAKIYVDAFPNTKRTIVYGSTEVEPVSSISAKSLIEESAEEFSGLLVGEIYRKTHVKIINISHENIPDCTSAEFESLAVEEGEIGEIVVSGNHVLKRYFNNETALKENKINVGQTIWHRTGDSGYRRKNKLYLTGRTKQLIQNENTVIAPFVVEYQLQSFEEINCGTAIELNDEIILVLESKLSGDKLASIISNITYDKIVVLDKMPMDQRHNSKIDYEKLKTML